ncbi:MAG: hypothetical protein PUC00_07250 [Clostridiales bacterium]|nr:hypothetical protein [Clostridiales bacterium]
MNGSVRVEPGETPLNELCHTIVANGVIVRSKNCMERTKQTVCRF